MPSENPAGLPTSDSTEPPPAVNLPLPPPPAAANAPLRPESKAPNPVRLVFTTLRFRTRMRRLGLLVLAGVAVAVLLPYVNRLLPGSKCWVGTAAKVDFSEVGAGLATRVKNAVARRAAVNLHEDFRSGLDNWFARNDKNNLWAFDQTGFVLPTRLAIYRPSVGLTDFTMDLLGELDGKAMSWVFRARDANNYYVAKLVVIQPGPLPRLALRHYSVVRGKETAQKTSIVPLTFRENPMLQIRLVAKGSDFSVYVQDRIVDSWTDSRFPSGAVGFFSGKGESSRIRWLHLEHQYDMAGRICAWLVSPGMRSSSRRWSGSWK